MFCGVKGNCRTAYNAQCVLYCKQQILHETKSRDLLLNSKTLIKFDLCLVMQVSKENKRDMHST